MAIFTTKQKSDLDNSMVAAQNVSLGTLISEMQYGSLATAPAVGTVDSLAVLSYAIAPVAPAANSVKDAYTLQTGVSANVTAGIKALDVPRNITVTGVGANTAGNVIIYGTNINDVAINETIVAANTTTVQGAKAFKTVTAITYPAKVDSSGETIAVGAGDKYGMPVAVPIAGMFLAKSFDGATDSGTAVGSTTVEGTTFDPAGTVNGTKILKLYLLA